MNTLTQYSIVYYVCQFSKITLNLYKLPTLKCELIHGCSLTRTIHGSMQIT